MVFLENYRVSLAEKLMPASEVSQQISTAGKEASGTGNMKFMMNGALTVGTLDGANVEMHDLLGDENMFLFGLRADEVEQMKREGYVPQRFYNHDPVLRRCLDALRSGFRDGVRYDDLYQRLLFGAGGSPADEYFLLADFDAYCKAEQRMAETYRDQTAWKPHEPPQHRPQRRVRRRPGRGAVRGQYLARALQGQEVNGGGTSSREPEAADAAPGFFPFSGRLSKKFPPGEIFSRPPGIFLSERPFRAALPPIPENKV